MLVKKLISSRNNEEASVDDGGCFQKVLNLDVDVLTLSAVSGYRPHHDQQPYVTQRHTNS